MNNVINKPFAEVIESSLHIFKAQSWQWDAFPAYGSLVTIKQAPFVYISLVYEVATGSMDPTRYPFPFQKTEEELKKEQPQIFEFLRTTFSSITLGYYHKGNFVYTAPAYPAKMHAFIEPIAPDMQRQFLAKPHYLHRIFALASHVTHLDDLLIAMLTNQHQEHPLSSPFMHTFMQTYSLLTANEYRRIKLFLQRIPAI
jgi:hypothetical protein